MSEIYKTKCKMTYKRESNYKDLSKIILIKSSILSEMI